MGSISRDVWTLAVNKRDLSGHKFKPAGSNRELPPGSTEHVPAGSTSFRSFCRYVDFDILGVKSSIVLH